MENGKKLLSALLLIAIAIYGPGCTRLFGPSDQDVIKAISDSGVLNDKMFTVAAPPEVLEKGKKAADGSWPVKVKLTLTLQLPDGKTSSRVTTPIFNIQKSKNSAGETIWTLRS